MGHRRKTLEKTWGSVTPTLVGTIRIALWTTWLRVHQSRDYYNGMILCLRNTYFQNCTRLEYKEREFDTIPETFNISAMFCHMANHLVKDSWPTEDIEKQINKHVENKINVKCPTSPQKLSNIIQNKVYSCWQRYSSLRFDCCHVLITSFFKDLSRITILVWK